MGAQYEETDSFVWKSLRGLLLPGLRHSPAQRRPQLQVKMIDKKLFIQC